MSFVSVEIHHIHQSCGMYGFAHRGLNLGRNMCPCVILLIVLFVDQARLLYTPTKLKGELYSLVLEFTTGRGASKAVLFVPLFQEKAMHRIHRLGGIIATSEQENNPLGD
jgi:hypothetical protein